MAKNRRPDREPGVRRKGYTVLVALVFFACLAGLPAILSALHLKISTPLPSSSSGIRLLGAPQRGKHFAGKSKTPRQDSNDLVTLAVERD